MENTHPRSTRKTDLEAVSPEGADCAIEVKYIGVEDWDFQNPSGGRAVSLHAASDFELFKLYTAAVQLKLTSKWRIVGLVISDYLTWPRFQLSLSQNWMGGQPLKRLNEVWIMKLQAGFQFSPGRSIAFSNNFSLQGKSLSSSQLCSR